MSGAEILDVPWEVNSGKIDKAAVRINFEQLFVDGQMMQEARWPNTSTSDLIRARHATCDNGTNDAVLVDDDLPQGDWNGTYVHIRLWPGWGYYSKVITNYKPGKSLDFVEAGQPYDSRRKIMPGDRYWLFGALAALDRATECTILEITLDCISGDISFYYKVSSERDCDLLEFYIDGKRKDRWSGEKDWVQVSFPVEEGTRIFKWNYSKDSSISRGSDTEWLDDIVFPVE